MSKHLLIINILLTGILLVFISIYVELQHKQQNTGQTQCTESLTREVDKRGDTETETDQWVNPPKVVGTGNTYGYGKVSWYGREACIANGTIYGSTCKTANGEIFDEMAFTMACTNNFTLGSTFELCSTTGGGCVIAICGDRGNFARLGRTFDFSRNLFAQFADNSRGVIEIRWRLIQ